MSALVCRVRPCPMPKGKLRFHSFTQIRESRSSHDEGSRCLDFSASTSCKSIYGGMNGAKEDSDCLRVELPDGRYIAYTIRGDSACPNVLVWLHGICSSRYECMSTGEPLLRELDACIIGFDRPGYGGSTGQRGRTFKSYVQACSVFVEAVSVSYLSVAQCRLAAGRHLCTRVSWGEVLPCCWGFWGWTLCAGLRKLQA